MLAGGLSPDPECLPVILAKPTLLIQPDFEGRSPASDVLRELSETIQVPMACQAIRRFFSRIAARRKTRSEALGTHLSPKLSPGQVRTAQNVKKTGTPASGRGALGSYILLVCSDLGLECGSLAGFLPRTNAWTALRLFPQPAAPVSPEPPTHAEVRNLIPLFSIRVPGFVFRCKSLCGKTVLRSQLNQTSRVQSARQGRALWRSCAKFGRPRRAPRKDSGAPT